MRKIFISAIAACAIAAMVVAGGAYYASLSIAGALGDVIGGLVSSAKAEEMIAGECRTSPWFNEMVACPQVDLDSDNDQPVGDDEVRFAIYEGNVEDEPAEEIEVHQGLEILPALSEVGSGIITIVSMSDVDEVIERIELAFAAGESISDAELQEALEKKAAKYRRERGLEFEQATLQ